MSCLQLFQRLAGGIVEYIIHGTGCQGKELTSFYSLLPSKLLWQGIKEFAFAVAGFKMGGLTLFGQVVKH